MDREMFSRRGLLVGGSAVLAAGLAPGVAGALAEGDVFVVADTSSGKVRGLNRAGIRTFKGLPYGGHTGGRNRFRPPTPAPTWTGIRDAFDYGQISPQLPASRASRFTDLIMFDRQPGGMGEDCLTLNLWTPSLSGKRPVMVYFHGGGYTSGSGNTPRYDGEQLARFGDAVVITVNHRLAAFGYLHLADAGAPAEFAQSGAAGVLDLVQALQWIRTNAERFGGDPSSVTIFGQSGGGAKASVVLAMPSAAGLFHKAGVISGSALRVQTREEGARNAAALMAALGIPRARVMDLQKVPFSTLLAAQATVGEGPNPAAFAPVMDGVAIPRHPFDPDAPSVSARVPMIIGTTLDERTTSLRNYDLDEAGLRRFFGEATGARSDDLLRLYREEDPGAPPFLIQARMDTDRSFRHRAITQAERKAKQGAAPAYFYQFHWRTPAYGGIFGAGHGADMGFVFKNLRDGITPTTPEVFALGDQVASAWVSFARTGDPNNAAIPRWPAYEAGSRPTMIFDTRTRVENDPRSRIREYWAGRVKA